MKIFVITLIIIALCVFALSFNIIFRKDGKFPDGEIAHNKALKKEGIQCAKVEERILWNKKGTKTKSSCTSADCSSCTADCSKQ